MADALTRDKLEVMVALAEQIARASPESAKPARQIIRLLNDVHSPDDPLPAGEATGRFSDALIETFSRQEPGSPERVTPFLHVLAGAHGSPAQPNVRTIRPADLKDVLAEGFNDFWEMPSHVAFLCVIYPILGVVLAGLTFSYNILPLLYPLAAGFALVGPLAAIGLYELSRRREQGLPTDWKYAFAVLSSPAITSIATLGLILLVIFLAWLITAQALYEWLYGYRPLESLPEFIGEALTTSRGWMLIILGNAIGFLFAAVVLAISVVSFPLLLDQDVGVPCAVQTSVRAVLKNPLTMALWGLIVAGLLTLGIGIVLVGLVIVLPILGHSTWHLYRRVVDPSGADARPAQA